MRLIYTHHISKLPLLLPVGSPLSQRLLLRVGRVLDLPGEAGAALVLPLVPVLLAVEDVADRPRKLLPVRRRLLQQLVDLPGGFPHPLVLVARQGLMKLFGLKPHLYQSPYYLVVCLELDIGLQILEKNQELEQYVSANGKIIHIQLIN